MNTADIVGYTYRADTYCPTCISHLIGGKYGRSGAEAGLDVLAGIRKVDRTDERSFDSGDFPKVIFGDQVHSGDEPDYCGSCHQLLAPYECSICGDEHGESAHGEPLVQRELHQRTLTDAVSIHLSDAQYIHGDNRLLDMQREWDTLTVSSADQYAPEYLDDIDAILHDAGYFPITNADQGAWLVYAPVPATVDA